MSMTSSFHVSLLALLLAALSGCMKVPAPDSPKAAPKVRPVAVKGVSAEEQAQRESPVELKSLAVRRLSEAAKEAAGPELRKAPDAIEIEVVTQRPLGDLSVGSAPVIVLNGERLLETRAVGENRLRVRLPDRKRIRENNTVTVVWMGRDTTLTRKPLTFHPSEIRDPE